MFSFCAFNSCICIPIPIESCISLPPAGAVAPDTQAHDTARIALHDLVEDGALGRVLLHVSDHLPAHLALLSEAIKRNEKQRTEGQRTQ